MNLNEDAYPTYYLQAQYVIAYVSLHLRNILIATSLGIVLALASGMIIPIQYIATVTVSPQEGVASDIGLSSFGKLSSLAGGALSGDAGTPFPPFLRFTETLTGTTLADKLATVPWVMPAIFEAQWNTKNKTWRRPSWVKEQIHNLKNAIFGGRVLHAPDSDDLQAWLARSIEVDRLATSPAYNITLKTNDAGLSARLLMLIVRTNDRIIQDDAKLRFNHTIAYLHERLKHETFLARYNVLSDLLLEQERGLMAASADGPYTAKIINREQVTFSRIKKYIWMTVTFIFVFLTVYWWLEYGYAATARWKRLIKSARAPIKWRHSA